MLCSNAEGASLKGCNFEDPSGLKANLEGKDQIPFVLLMMYTPLRIRFSDILVECLPKAKASSVHFNIQTSQMLKHNVEDCCFISI